MPVTKKLVQTDVDIRKYLTATKKKPPTNIKPPPPLPKVSTKPDVDEPKQQAAVPKPQPTKVAPPIIPQAGREDSFWEDKPFINSTQTTVTQEMQDWMSNDADVIKKFQEKNPGMFKFPVGAKVNVPGKDYSKLGDKAIPTSKPSVVNAEKTQAKIDILKAVQKAPEKITEFKIGDKTPSMGIFVEETPEEMLKSWFEENKAEIGITDGNPNGKSLSSMEQIYGVEVFSGVKNAKGEETTWDPQLAKDHIYVNSYIEVDKNGVPTGRVLGKAYDGSMFASTEPRPIEYFQDMNNLLNDPENQPTEVTLETIRWAQEDGVISDDSIYRMKQLGYSYNRESNSWIKKGAGFGGGGEVGDAEQYGNGAYGFSIDRWKQGYNPVTISDAWAKELGLTSGDIGERGYHWDESTQSWRKAGSSSGGGGGGGGGGYGGDGGSGSSAYPDMYNVRVGTG